MFACGQETLPSRHSRSHPAGLNNRRCRARAEHGSWAGMNILNKLARAAVARLSRPLEWENQETAESRWCQVTRAQVITLPQVCWKCMRPISCVLGVLALAAGGRQEVAFVPFMECAEKLAALLSEALLAAAGAGPLRPRYSRTPRGCQLGDDAHSYTILGLRRHL